MRYEIKYTIDDKEYIETAIEPSIKRAEKWFELISKIEHRKNPNSEIKCISVTECERVLKSFAYSSPFCEKEYYIGDPCYVLPDEVYYGVWEKKYDFRDGEICTKNGSFTVFGTAYGDGCYLDSDGHKYGVDSGTIAIVPIPLIDESKRRNFAYGRIVKGTSVIFESDTDGYFRIAVKGKKNYEFTIDTVVGDEDDE